MSDRKTEAYWSESQQRWQCLVQREGVRKAFYSTKKNSLPDCKKGKIEAEHKADAWLDGENVNEKTPCSRLLDKYVEDVKSRTGTSNSVQVDKFVHLYIKPGIGKIKIGRLNQGDLQDVLNKAYRDRKLSDKTLRCLRATETQFVKYCRKHQYTKLYPEDLEIPSGAARSQRRPLAPDDLTTLFSVSTTKWHGKDIEEPFIYAYRFAAVTGLRPGELVGLQWKDINKNVYTIRRSINGYGEVTSGKNENANRSGELGEIAQGILEDQRHALAERRVIGLYVFPDSDGGPISYKRYWNHWKRFCAVHDIKEGTKPYELRHTFVSINDEMPEGLKKMVMGHSKNMDTEGVYGHEMKGQRAKAARYIDAAFDEFVHPPKKEEVK